MISLIRRTSHGKQTNADLDLHTVAAGSVTLTENEAAMAVSGNYKRDLEWINTKRP